MATQSRSFFGRGPSFKKSKGKGGNLDEKSRIQDGETYIGQNLREKDSERTLGDKDSGSSRFREKDLNPSQNLRDDKKGSRRTGSTTDSIPDRGRVPDAHDTGSTTDSIPDRGRVPDARDTGSTTDSIPDRGRDARGHTGDRKATTPTLFTRDVDPGRIPTGPKQSPAESEVNSTSTGSRQSPIDPNESDPTSAGRSSLPFGKNGVDGLHSTDGSATPVLTRRPDASELPPEGVRGWRNPPEGTNYNGIKIKQAKCNQFQFEFGLRAAQIIRIAEHPQIDESWIQCQIVFEGGDVPGDHNLLPLQGVLDLNDTWVRITTVRGESDAEMLPPGKDPTKFGKPFWAGYIDGRNSLKGIQTLDDHLHKCICGGDKSKEGEPFILCPNGHEQHLSCAKSREKRKVLLTSLRWVEKIGWVAPPQCVKCGHDLKL